MNARRTRTVTEFATEDRLVETVVSTVSSVGDRDRSTVRSELANTMNPDALGRLFRRQQGQTTLLFRVADCEVSVSSDGRVVATGV